AGVDGRDIRHRPGGAARYSRRMVWRLARSGARPLHRHYLRLPPPAAHHSYGRDARPSVRHLVPREPNTRAHDSPDPGDWSALLAIDDALCARADARTEGTPVCGGGAYRRHQHREHLDEAHRAESAEYHHRRLDTQYPQHDYWRGGHYTARRRAA